MPRADRKIRFEMLCITQSRFSKRFVSMFGSMEFRMATSIGMAIEKIIFRTGIVTRVIKV